MPQPICVHYASAASGDAQTALVYIALARRMDMSVLNTAYKQARVDTGSFDSTSSTKASFTYVGHAVGFPGLLCDAVYSR